MEATNLAAVNGCECGDDAPCGVYDSVKIAHDMNKVVTMLRAMAKEIVRIDRQAKERDAMIQQVTTTNVVMLAQDITTIKAHITAIANAMNIPASYTPLPELNFGDDSSMACATPITVDFDEEEWKELQDYVDY